MKDRLIEQLDTFCQKEFGTNFNKDILDKFADYLIANGVIIPPVKIGQSFWHIEEYKHRLLPNEYPPAKVVCESKVEKIYIEKYENSFGDTRKRFGFNDIGKTVFLTREEEEEKTLNRKEGI